MVIIKNVKKCIPYVAFGLLMLGCVLLDGRAGGEQRRTQRIVFLGDSLTAGFELRPDEAYPALISEKIAQRNWDFRVINAGVSGDTTADGLTRLPWVLRGGADVLVVALGANDGLRGLPPALTANNLGQIIDRARQTNPRVRILLAGILVPTNMGKAYSEEFAGVFAKVATEKELPLLPFLLEGVAAKAQLNLPDGLHPNAAGHKIIAETVWQKLEPMLADLNK